jgi:hypothetical protein
MSLFERNRRPEEPNPYQTPSTVAWKRVPDPQSVQ